MKHLRLLIGNIGIIIGVVVAVLVVAGIAAAVFLTKKKPGGRWINGDTALMMQT